MKSIHKKSLLRRENWMEGFHEGVSLGQEIWMKCIQDKSLSLGRKLDEMHPNRSLSWKRKLNERLPRRTLSRENWMKCIPEVVSLLLLQQICCSSGCCGCCVCGKSSAFPGRELRANGVPEIPCPEHPFYKVSKYKSLIPASNVTSQFAV
jgi:hypothetical protein